MKLLLDQMTVFRMDGKLSVLIEDGRIVSICARTSAGAGFFV